MRAAAATVLFAAALAVAGYWAWQQTMWPHATFVPPSAGESVPAASPARDAARATSASAANQAASVTSTQAERKPVAAAAPPDFAARLAQLERAANEGDMAAAAELGERLALCRDYAPMSAQAVEASIVTGMAANEPPPAIGGKPASPEFLILLLQEGYAELDRHCAGSERIIDAARAQSSLDWLQRAAEAGEVAAMTSYARYTLADESEAAVDGAAAARRARALEYLDRAIRAGDARALQLRSDLYSHGIVLPADAVAAYADLHAFARTDLGRQWPPRLVELYLQALAQPLDASQLAEAQRRGDALWRACCAR